MISRLFFHHPGVFWGQISTKSSILGKYLKFYHIYCPTARSEVDPFGGGEPYKAKMTKNGLKFQSQNFFSKSSMDILRLKRISLGVYLQIWSRDAKP